MKQHAILAYYTGDGGSKGIAIYYGESGNRLTRGKVYGVGKTVATFQMNIEEIEEAVNALNSVLLDMQHDIIKE